MLTGGDKGTSLLRSFQTHSPVSSRGKESLPGTAGWASPRTPRTGCRRGFRSPHLGFGFDYWPG